MFESDQSIAKRMVRPLVSKKPLKMVRRKIPPEALRFAEKSVKKKFVKKPRLYTYEPQKGHFRKRTKTEGWDASSYRIYDKADKPATRTIIVLPRSTLRNKKVRNATLVHELSEVLCAQGSNKHQATVCHNMGLKAERAYAKKVGMTRRDVTYETKKLFNDKQSW